MGEKFRLMWHTYTTHGQELFRNLLETQQFTDVTLISDDRKQYRVHKFILSACSTVFREIITSNPLNTAIYLRGIYHEELESILQFIYLGVASIYHERMNEFLNVAKNLDIKEIGKNVIDADEDSQNVDNNESCVYQEDSVISDEIRNNDVDMSTRPSQDKNEDSSYSLIPDNRKPYNCQKCEYQSNHKEHIKRHIRSIHEGIKYPCQQCDYQATQAVHY